MKPLLVGVWQVLGLILKPEILAEIQWWKTKKIKYPVLGTSDFESKCKCKKWLSPHFGEIEVRADNYKNLPAYYRVMCSD